MESAIQGLPVCVVVPMKQEHEEQDKFNSERREWGRCTGPRGGKRAV